MRFGYFMSRLGNNLCKLKLVYVNLLQTVKNMGVTTLRDKVKPNCWGESLRLKKRMWSIYFFNS